MVMNSPEILPVPWAGAPQAHWTSVPESLPAMSGAYLLLLRLNKPAPLPKRFGDLKLLPGLYVYAGSARGPGGIRARCARHFRHDKKLHLHVDWLTKRATSFQAAAFTNRAECSLITQLMQSGSVEFSYKGFGSSDCTRCNSHLLKLMHPLP